MALLLTYADLFSGQRKLCGCLCTYFARVDHRYR